MFSGAPSMLPGEGEQVLIHAFTGSGDVARLTHQSFNVNSVVKAYDTRWQAAYQGVPLSDTEIDWEIAEITSGVTFDEIPEGGKARLYKYSRHDADDQDGQVRDADRRNHRDDPGQPAVRIRQRRAEWRADALFTLWADTHYDLLWTPTDRDRVRHHADYAGRKGRGHDQHGAYHDHEGLQGPVRG